MKLSIRFSGALLCALAFTFSAQGRQDSDALFALKIQAPNKSVRNQIAALGLAIDALYSDSVGVIASAREMRSLRKAGIRFEANRLPQREGNGRGFPSADKDFHDYSELTSAIDGLVAQYPAIASKFTIGKSIEGRELIGVRLSSNPTGDSLPTAIIMGCHHAREHLSVEVPLRAAKHLATQYGSDAQVTKLLDEREVWFLPMINPDGAEHDIASGSYRWWRKNRRDNGDGTRGVDLNRNYGTGFGGPGSSNDSSSDTYHGPSSFSEPETAAVRDFVRARKNATVLLSFHSFSELVLWPWGHKDDAISDQKDRLVFETMGKKMASFNRYTPQKSSELYLASGDTTDWAYDERKIFAFTIELSPDSLFGGGFYPGAAAIEPTFKANLKPILYLIESAANPYAVVP